MGILTEPTSAAAYSLYLKNLNFFGETLILVTGSGMKTIEVLKDIF